jgi:hypothetical protein
VIDVVHHVVCRHRVELEVWPPRVEVCFRDDRGVNPINAQVRFEATLYNAATGAVTWEVHSLTGGPGAGSIDASGRYLAPDKGALPSGHTDVVVATPGDDPLRKAYAWVTLVGKGPAPVPKPRIEISPKRVYLYYPQNQLADDRNEFIDDSNKMQLFRAYLFDDGGGSEVEWLVDNVAKPNPLPSSLFLYEVTGFGSTKVVVVTARIQAQPSVKDEAKVVQINYTWPKMRPVAQL